MAAGVAGAAACIQLGLRLSPSLRSPRLKRREESLVEGGAGRVEGRWGGEGGGATGARGVPGRVQAGGGAGGAGGGRCCTPG